MRRIKQIFITLVLILFGALLHSTFFSVTIEAFAL